MSKLFSVEDDLEGEVDGFHVVHLGRDQAGHHVQVILEVITIICIGSKFLKMRGFNLDTCL